MEFGEKTEEDDNNLRKMEILEPSVMMPHTLIYSTPLLQGPTGKNHLGFTISSIDSGFAENSFNASSVSHRSGSFFSTSSPSTSNSTFFSPEDKVALSGRNLYSKYELSPLREFSSLQGRRLTFEQSEIQQYFPISDIDIQFPDLEQEPCKDNDTPIITNDRAEENLKESTNAQPFLHQIDLGEMCTSSNTNSPLSGSATDLEFSLQEMSLEELTSCSSSGSRSSPCCMKQSVSQDSLPDSVLPLYEHITQISCDKDIPDLISDPLTGTDSTHFYCCHKCDDTKSGHLNRSQHNKCQKHSFQKVLKHFSPSEPSRLIGRNTGVKKIDIIHHLSENFPLILQRIFELLSPSDLSSVCKVSTNWEKCLHKDTRALLRYKKYLEQIKQTSLLKRRDKENTTEKLLEEGTLKILTGTRGLLTTLQTQATTNSENKTLATSRAENQAAESKSFKPYILKSEDKLRSCPRCQYSAVIKPAEDRATCMKESCGYDFCTKCFSTFHHPKRCKPLCNLASTAGVAGTRKSKKNLKRL